MVVAYIFVITKPGTRSDVSKDSFTKLKGVKDVAEVYGEYDLVVKVQVENMGDLQKFILSLRDIGGVEKTTTMISVKD